MVLLAGTATVVVPPLTVQAQPAPPKESARSAVTGSALGLVTEILPVTLTLETSRAPSVTWTW